MHMTLRRLQPIIYRVLGQAPQNVTPADTTRLDRALEQRRGERNRSKLARRLRRKAQLGMAGAF